jgi:hypothetical protein
VAVVLGGKPCGAALEIVGVAVGKHAAAQGPEQQCLLRGIVEASDSGRADKRGRAVAARAGG